MHGLPNLKINKNICNHVQQCLYPTSTPDSHSRRGWQVNQVVAKIITRLCSAGFDSGSYFNFPFPKSRYDAQHKGDFPLHHIQFIEENST